MGCSGTNNYRKLIATRVTPGERNHGHVLWRSAHQYATTFLGASSAGNHRSEGKRHPALHLIYYAGWYVDLRSRTSSVLGSEHVIHCLRVQCIPQAITNKHKCKHHYYNSYSRKNSQISHIVSNIASVIVDH